MKLSRATGNRRLAFTLIELILAIGVAALVLVAINAVFFTSLHLREVTTAAVDEATPLDAALTTMRRDLRCVVPFGSNSVMVGDFKAGDVASVGVVDPVNLEIYTATGALSADSASPWGDVQRVTYGLKTQTTAGGRSKELIRTVTRNLLSQSVPEIEEQTLLNNVQNLQVQCFDGMQWFDQWDTSSTSMTLNTNLPVAVRVRLQLAASNNQNQTPIEILVPIDSQSRTNS